MSSSLGHEAPEGWVLPPAWCNCVYCGAFCKFNRRSHRKHRLDPLLDAVEVNGLGDVGDVILLNLSSADAGAISLAAKVPPREAQLPHDNNRIEQHELTRVVTTLLLEIMYV